MAELVDALVSNTSGFTSMPVRSRLWSLRLPYSVNLATEYKSLTHYTKESVVVSAIRNASATRVT